jgi:hypothetical protein
MLRKQVKSAEGCVQMLFRLAYHFVEVGRELYRNLEAIYRFVYHI